VNPVRFFVKNPVAANLLMWAIIVTGTYWWLNLIREFFPNSEPEQIAVTVVWPGATPEEVEKAITRRIEREIEDVEDVKEIASSVYEGVTVVRVELESDSDRGKVLEDLRTEIDKVKPDLPDGAEDPEIAEARPLVPVIGIVLYGDVDEARLREVTRETRDDLVDMPEISDVVVSGIRDREILAEVRPEALEEHRLTFEDVGRAIASMNLDLPGGQLESERGNVRVRTVGEQDRARKIEDLLVRVRPDGPAIRLGEVAAVREGFEDRVERGNFRGRRAALVTVFKTPEQDALKIAKAVKDYVADDPGRLGGAVRLEITTDLARFIDQRLDLMKRNARIGALLVLITLAFFLDLKVAFWVAVGLPVSFLGTFTLMHFFGATINLLSLFGLIIVLGMLVDDAIVVGESVFTKMEQGMPPAEATIAGASEVAMPVVCAVATTIAAFLPLMFIEGTVGAFMGVLPIVVMSALFVSIIESFTCLPAHLAHRRRRGAARPPRFPRLARVVARIRARRDNDLNRRLPDAFERLLRFALRWRYPVIAGAVGLSLAVGGLLAGGVIPFVLFPETDAETVTVDLEMAAGTPEDQTRARLEEIERILLATPEVKSAFVTLGSSFGDRGLVTPADPATVGQIVVELTPAEDREERKEQTSRRLVAEWREKTSNIPGVARLAIRSRAGGPGGTDIEVRVRADDLATAQRAVAHVREVLGTYDGVSEIEDDLSEGKLEVRLRLRETARAIGLSTVSLAAQVRHALYGFEAQELQGEDEEVKVRAVLPKSARRDIGDLGALRISTPGGGRAPLSEVAELSTERGFAALARVDGKRAITVKAEVDEDRANTNEVTTDLAQRLSDIGVRFPGVVVSFEGQRKETAESLGSLKYLFPAALLFIYAIIAVLFRSYFQPLVVMLAIPYSFVGAVLGHLIMGFPLTLLSLIGGVALAGVVVNDSLILVDFVNRRRREGLPLAEALVVGGRSRLRAIILTSVTTIFGVGPLMLERSYQAQFLIPMAISLAFGLAFATVLTLVLLPSILLALDDLRRALRWLFGVPERPEGTTRAES
jgi:multidrug efflux pump subunit AcrB